MTFDSTRFVNIGERTNVTGSAAFKKLILAGDYAKAVEADTARAAPRKAATPAGAAGGASKE